MKRNTCFPIVVFCLVTSLLLSSCAMPNATPTPTNTPAATNTPKPTATFTPKPTITFTPTATPNLEATKQVEDFLTKIKEYYDAGYISTMDGSYTHLDDFSYAWAKLNYYQWVDTGLSPTDFVIKSNISWTSASSAADSSGCGYVFRVQDNYDHYAFFISLKGVIEAATNVGGWNSMGVAAYGKPSRNGKALVTLIVEGNKFRVLVDDKLIKTYSGYDGKLMTGSLAYTVVSGTNKSYGTQCTFKNTEIWTIKK